MLKLAHSASKEMCLELGVHGPRVSAAVQNSVPKEILPSTGHKQSQRAGPSFLVFGQRLEMNQRTASHSATVRSSEISDVCLLHAALLHSQHISCSSVFFFPPSWTFDCKLRGCVSWLGQRKWLALTQILCGLFLRYTSGVLWPQVAEQVKSNYNAAFFWLQWCWETPLISPQLSSLNIPLCQSLLFLIKFTCMGYSWNDTAALNLD